MLNFRSLSGSMVVACMPAPLQILSTISLGLLRLVTNLACLSLQVRRIPFMLPLSAQRARRKRVNNQDHVEIVRPIIIH